MSMLSRVPLPKSIVLLLIVLAAFAAPRCSKAQTTTTTTLQTTSCSTTGCSTTLTATVTAGTAPVHPGLVLFCKANVLDCADSLPLGQAQLLTNGTATVKVVLPTGSNSIHAIFQGTKTYSKSESAVQSAMGGGFVATPNPATTTTINATTGQPGFTADVTGYGKIIPKGMVSFLDTSNSNTVIASAPLGSGSIVGSYSSTGLDLSKVPANLLTTPTGASTGDFNNDGFLDVVEVGPDGVNVLLGDGKGGFLPGPAGHNNVGTQLNQVLVADFNGDGKLDIVVPDSSNSKIYISLGNGDGTFTDAAPSALSGSLVFLTQGDFNNDGIPDLISITGSSSTTYAIQPLLGKGDGTFTPSTAFSNGTSFYSLFVADFNRDGNLDLAVQTNGLYGFMLLGNGDGSFTSFPQSVFVGGTITGGDFNNDGIPDMVVWTDHPWYYQGNGDGTFTQTNLNIPASNDRTESIMTGDFNGDGILDVATVMRELTPESGDNLYTYMDFFYGVENKTSGFTLNVVPGSFGLGTTPNPTVVTADFNGEGAPALLAFNTGAGSTPGTAPISSLISYTSEAIAYTPTYAPLSPGTHNIVASYPGDSNHTASVSAPSSITVAAPPPVFTNTSGLQLNGGASLQGTAIQLTDGKPFEARSFFRNYRMSVDGYNTQFDFQITNANSDGFAFVVQSNGPNALGSSGGGVGYGRDPDDTSGPSIPNSYAIIFDLHNNQGEGSNSIRLALNGDVTPGTVPLNGTPGSGLTQAFDLTPSGIDLHSGHPFRANINYNGVVTFYLTDLTNNRTVSYTFQTGDLLRRLKSNGVGDTIGYIGFTAATGATTSDIKILGWNYTYNPCCGSSSNTGPTFGGGFAGGGQYLQLNGGAAISGSALQLTNSSTFEATSAYTTQEIIPEYFATDFDFNMGNGNGDGFAFVLQHQAANAVGMYGGGLGYGPDMPGGSGNKIGKSVAIKFDLHNNAGEGTDSTGIYVDGASPTVPSVNLGPSGINLHNGHTFHARICYCDEANLSLTITDLNDFTVFNTSFPIDLVTTIGPAPPYDSLAWPGFTAGTGASANTIQILNWKWIYYSQYEQ